MRLSSPESETEAEPEPGTVIRQSFYRSLRTGRLSILPKNLTLKSWKHLEPPTRAGTDVNLQSESVSVDLSSYEVINEPPHIPFTEIKTEPEIPKQKRGINLPKLPLQDFFAALFSPPKVLETVPSELEYLGRI